MPGLQPTGVLRAVCHDLCNGWLRTPVLQILSEVNSMLNLDMVDTTVEFTGILICHCIPHVWVVRSYPLSCLLHWMYWEQEQYHQHTKMLQLFDSFDEVFQHLVSPGCSLAHQSQCSSYYFLQLQGYIEGRKVRPGIKGKRLFSSALQWFEIIKKKN